MLQLLHPAVHTLSWGRDQRSGSQQWLTQTLVHHYCRHRLTPQLTPLRAQHAETAGNRQQRNRLRYANSATPGNAQKRMTADCGSEGRGFEPRRSPSLIPHR